MVWWLKQFSSTDTHPRREEDEQSCPHCCGTGSAFDRFGLFWRSPFLTLNAIRQGFEERDAGKVAQYIDFPTLRQNLKDHVGAAALAAANEAPEDNPFGSVFTALAPGSVGSLIDSYVTPSGLA